MKTRCAVFFLSLLSVIGVAPATAALLYPLQQPQAISSNFGQYRHGHAHAGLDLWSFLRLDAPVLAAADGVIYRLQVAPTGYGRVLYQRLNDGRTAVYGHLSSFSPKIEKTVRALQQRDGRFRVNTALGRDEIPVKRGEVLGTVGDTATDVPHLHFELRNPGGEPINPLTADFPYQDTSAPVIRALYLEPLSPEALIDDEPEERLQAFETDSRQANSYRLPTIRIAGKVGLAVEAYDFIDGSPRPLAPYDIRLMIDGEEWFSHRFDRYNYADPSISLLSYHTELMASQQRSFIRLYRLHRKTAFHPTAKTGDLSRLSPGEHRVEILVTDEKGLQAVGRFIIAVAPPSPLRRTASTAVNSGLLEQSLKVLSDATLTWRQEAIEINGQGGLVDGAPPTIHASFQPGGQKVPEDRLLWKTNGERFTLRLPLPPPVENGAIEVLFIWPDENRHWTQSLRFAYQTAMNGKTLSYAGDRLRLSFPQDALYRPLPLVCQVQQPAVPPWLEAVGSLYSISPSYEPLRREATVTIAPPAGVSRQGLGVYFFDRGSWYHLGTGTQARTPVFGSFALLRDIEAPRIGEIFADPQGTRITIRVSDCGSGIADSDILLKLDGKLVVAEYQPLKDQILCQINPPLAPGQHLLVVQVQDRAGNRTDSSRSFNNQ